MPLKEELEKAVKEIFASRWTPRNGTTVPEDKTIGLGNDAVKFKATVLYADLADSTEMVKTEPDYRAAEIYKTFLHCAAKIIRSEGGTITAYDGDRIMAVYIGDDKNPSAARTALKIKWAVNNIIRPTHKKQYPNSTYNLSHVVGIDTSDLFVARTGVRGANDLVWVGTSANYAAKMAALPDAYSTYITAEVYNSLTQVTKLSNGTNMWQAATWNGITIYRSNYL
jgi:class 3 adenylate cyclase